MRREIEDGLTEENARLTVAGAVEDFLQYGLGNAAVATQNNYESVARLHVVPLLGAYRVRDLRASHVDGWLHGLKGQLSTRSLRLAHGLLNRAVRRAMARDQISRNVVELVQVPQGRSGWPSKSLSVEQAHAVLEFAKTSPMYAYIVVSLLTGARTEEIRPLIWSRTHLEFDHSVEPPIPPHLKVWRSVRLEGETKTRLSRRSLALPEFCVEVLTEHCVRQTAQRQAAGSRWHENDLVFTTSVGTELDASNVRRAFRKAIAETPGIDPSQWTPRELRHSFVSLLSDQQVPIEEISRLVGHSSTSVTETVYRHQLRPVVQRGAEAMDDLFGKSREASE